ncbi:gp007 [Rhodococcus phage ReqiDocB7]|uniref:tail protein n=1 Tax=Rhodococcus phage ReqiDocB7 TaxID=691966 RepID=UPI0001CDEA90|nr:tail protein [Rhodococcus phage ReqiDocB7]ADD80793.1 gp007 [Rhodococcus phage ReqiDocB7]
MTTPTNPVVDALWERIAAISPRASGFNVKLYGAKGDGVNDDLPAILAAIDAANLQGGGAIYFPAGMYNISASISNGAQGFTSIRFTGDGVLSSVIVALGDFPVFAGALHNCKLDNILVHENGQGAPGMNVYLDKSYIEHLKIVGWSGSGMRVNDGTYGDLGLLNHINDVHIEQAEGYGIYATYMFADSWIRFCNIGSTLANLSLEGGPIRVLGNHLNGSPRHNIELRGNRRVTISDNIMEGSRREALIYTMPPWLTVDNPQVQITGNAFSNGGKENKNNFSAIKFTGVDSAKLVNDLSVTGNIFACDDPDAGWKYIVEAMYADRISVTGNQWKTAYSMPEPVAAPQAKDLNVVGNSGGGNVAQIRVYSEANYSGTKALPSYAQGSLTKIRLTGNTTITLPNGTSGQSYTITLEVTQDATGGKTFAIPGVAWAGGAAPIVSAGPNEKDIIHITWTGTGWIGVVGAQKVGSS